MTDDGPVRWFAELALDDRAAVGGKGASLGELTRAGLPVPPGFVIPTPLFESFLSAADPARDLRRAVAALDHRDAGAIAATCRDVRNRLRRTPVPLPVRDAVTGAYGQLARGGGCPVAVRSSATCEDSDDASFAGLQDTYLWVLSADDLIDRVRDCWASLYNDESVTYRLRLGIPEADVSIAVVVQQMIDAECAGVMFTRSPTTGDKSVILVEGSWGLGSCLVGGEVTPDRFVINKVTGEVNRRDVSEKATEHIPDRDAGGVREVAVDAARRQQSCLDDDRLAVLWRLGRDVEQHYGAPQDIEWAMPRASAGDEPVYLLQSRPETVWANRERAPKAAPAERNYDHLVNMMSARSRKT